MDEPDPTVMLPKSPRMTAWGHTLDSGADHYVPDEDGVGVDEGVGVYPRCDAIELVNGHGRGRYTWAAIQLTPW